MKKVIVILTLLFSSTIKSQTIFNLNISPTSDDSIVDVNLDAVTSTLSEFISQTYSFDNNIITMEVCYFVTGFQQPVLYNHTFPLTVPSDGDYTIIINLYRSQTENTCDFIEFTDSASLNFSTPLTETVFLSVGEYEKFKNQISVIPNPVKTNLKYKTSYSIEIKSVVLYSILGEKLKTFPGTEADINVSSFSNGLYFVIFNTNKGIVQKQVVIDN